jgi:hypothetical protein
MYIVFGMAAVTGPTQTGNTNRLVLAMTVVAIDLAVCAVQREPSF